MGRRSKTQQLTTSIAGQHLALSVAAHLARTQLVPDPLNVYDAQHMSEMLDVVARALSRVAPIYVCDAAAADPRPLTPAELETATIRRSATILVLADGRSFSSATIKRLDLRQAIAILKTVGLEELQPRGKAAERRPDEPKTQKLLAQLEEVECLLEPPLSPGHLERAGHHMISIAREAPHGRVANLAMRLMSALLESRGAHELPPSVRAELARLRAAVEDVQRA
ncbi:MAG TPA: hypothetical protein VF280_13325 [Burkholderiales bacterium]